MPGSAKRCWIASPTGLTSSKRGPSHIDSAGPRRNRRKERRRRDRQLWKCRAVESLENQRQVFHPSHRPWKSLPRFPHSHSFGDCSYLIRKGKQKRPFLQNQQPRVGQRKPP